MSSILPAAFLFSLSHSSAKSMASFKLSTRLDSLLLSSMFCFFFPVILAGRVLCRGLLLSSLCSLAAWNKKRWIDYILGSVFIWCMPSAFIRMNMLYTVHWRVTWHTALLHQSLMNLCFLGMNMCPVYNRAITDGQLLWQLYFIRMASCLVWNFAMSDNDMEDLPL